jgi:ATP/maltotriose-dependent transcriptional regulator MalT
VATLALLHAAYAHGVCMELPSADLRAVDNLAAGYPERGVAEATRRLSLTDRPPDTLTQAQLYAIIAEVRAAQGRSADAHAAVVAARQRLDALPTSPLAQTLRNRLTISDVGNATTRGDLLVAMKSLDEVVARTLPGTLERVCALAARADLRAEALELDHAAADGIEAYTTAEHHGFELGRVQAAASLAEIYRRSGLLDEAGRMLDEWIPIEQAQDHPAEVATALYLRGQVLLESRNYGAARAALEASRRMAEASGDHFSAMFTDVALCPVLIGAGDLTAAARVCTEHAAEFGPAGRTDITSNAAAPLPHSPNSTTSLTGTQKTS